MAENKDGQEKTEPASARRLSDARDRGQVAKSQDVTTAAVLLVGSTLVYLSGGSIASDLRDLTRKIMMHAHELEITPQNVSVYFISLGIFMAKLLLPILISIAVLVLTVDIAQIGLHFASKKFTKGLNWKSIFNPFGGIKRILFSSRSMFELMKSILKIMVLGYIVYTVFIHHSEDVFHLMEKNVTEFGLFIEKVAIELILKVGGFFALIAVSDWFFQKFKYKQDLKMTKQEVTEENKQSEGDPKVKSRIRSIMRNRLRKLMLSRVAQADVVITNPTHFAIALEYKKDKTSAPIVLAKGLDFLALKIREKANEHGIPIVEQPPLARNLYYSVDIDQQIPEDLFKAVAQVLAYVYHLNNSKTTHFN